MCKGINMGRGTVIFLPRRVLHEERTHPRHANAIVFFWCENRARNQKWQVPHRTRALLDGCVDIIISFAVISFALVYTHGDGRGAAEGRRRGILDRETRVKQMHRTVPVFQITYGEAATDSIRIQTSH